MAVKATNLTPAEAYDLLKRTARNALGKARAHSNALANPTPRTDITLLWQKWAQFHTSLTSLASTPGLLDYAREQENDLLYDAVAEYQNLITDIETVLTEIETTFPQDPNGFLLVQKFGTRVNADFPTTTIPAAALANLRSLLDAVATRVE